MKKILTLLLSVIITLSLVACGNKVGDSTTSTKINTISTADLSDREEALMRATSDLSFVFEFNVDNNYKEVSVWLEKYEFGKKVEEAVAGSIRTPIQGEGMIIFSSSKITNSMENNEKLISLVIKSQNGISKGTSVIEVMKNKSNSFSSTWSNNQSKNNPSEGKITLGSICYSKDGAMSSITRKFFQNAENNLDEIKDYDEVYLLRCEFIS